MLTDARLIPEAIAAALEVRALPQQELIAAVVDFLSPRTLLLVLDNCEHVLATTSTIVNTLLRGAPQLTVVATSREPLSAPGEVVFRVPSLEIPNPERALSPHQLLECESVSLFVARAAAAVPGFELCEANAEDIVRICLRLDGLPLALELAAGRLGALSPAAIVARLDDRFRLLRTGSHTAPTRQQTLTATLQWSHDLLEPDEAVLFRRLGIFAGGFQLEAVEEVCAGGGLGDSDIADVLARLAEKSLVAVDDGRRGRRYRLLETVRMYARGSSGPRTPASARHSSSCMHSGRLRSLSSSTDRLASTVRDRTCGARSTHCSRMRRAMRSASASRYFRSGSGESSSTRPDGASPKRSRPPTTAPRSEPRQCSPRPRFTSAGARSPKASPSPNRAVRSRAKSATRTTNGARCSSSASSASPPTPWAPRHRGWSAPASSPCREQFAAAEAISIHSLGVAAWILGDLESADDLVAQSIEALLRALAGSPDTIPSPLNIAEIRPDDPQGRLGVQHLFEDTLQPFVEVSADAAASYALANQASIARARGELARAWRLLDESEARFEAAGDDAGLATVLVRRAYTSLAANDVAAAHADLERALDLRAGLSDRRGRGLILSGLGLVETTMGDFDAAERHLAEARDIFRRAGDRWGLASMLWRTADRLRTQESRRGGGRAPRGTIGVGGDAAGALACEHPRRAPRNVATLRGDAQGAATPPADARARRRLRRRWWRRDCRRASTERL